MSGPSDSLLPYRHHTPNSAEATIAATIRTAMISAPRLSGLQLEASGWFAQYAPATAKYGPITLARSSSGCR